MRPPARLVAGARPALLAAVVVSVVLGILGMHALDTHGVAGGGHRGTSAHPAHGHPDPAGAPVAHSPVGATLLDASAGGHGTGEMVMLCVAMLAAAGAALLLLLRPRVHVPWARLRHVATAVARLLPGRRATGPPLAWRFSVIRC